MKKTHSFLLTVCIMLALAFTLSCSDDKDNNSGGGGPDLSGSPINLFSLPEEAKQVYRITYHYADEHNDEGLIIDSKEPYEGNDIEIYDYIYSDEGGSQKVNIGTIEGGKISFSDINIDNKYLENAKEKMSGGDREGMVCSGPSVPDDLFMYEFEIGKARAELPGEYCSLYAFLIKSDEVYQAGLAYFSKAATISGSLNCTYKGQTMSQNVNLSVSKGFNLIYDGKDHVTSSNISKIGTLEFGLVCDD